MTLQHSLRRLPLNSFASAACRFSTPLLLWVAALLIVFTAMSPLATAQSCTGLCLQQTSCSGGATTSITGFVYVPNGVDPLPNVLVYIPNAPVGAFTPGVQCLQAGAPVSGSPLVSTYTAVDGSFTLTNVPVGTNIPLVIQAGKWRRQLVIPATTACANTVFSTRMPQNQSEGDIPLIAISTGSVDALECVLRRTGISDSEFTDPGGTGRVQFFKGSGSPGAKIDSSTPSETTLVSSPSTLANYDMVMFPCQGAQYNQTSTDQTNLINYANAGGRVFATHFSYVWLYNDAPFSGVADWDVNQAQLPDGTATINTNFDGGKTLAQWLLNAGASTTYGQIAINTLRHDQDGIVAPTQTWLNLNDSGAGNPSMQFTFNTPVGADASSQCGRVLFNEYHVENASNTNGQTFPAECPSLSTPMTAQEKMLEYALFDLSTFVTPVIAPTVGVAVTHSPSTYTEGDTGDNVTVNVTNTSTTTALNPSIVLTVTLPTGVTATSMTDTTGGWNCTVATLTCTRTTGLAASASDAISITTNVAANAPVGSAPAIGVVSGGGLSSNVTGTDTIPIIGAPVVTWATPTPILYGTPVSSAQLDAVGNTTGSYTYTYASGPHAGQVVAPGTVLDAGSYPMTVVFTPADQAHYPGTATTNVTLVVNPIPQAITFTLPATGLYGAAIPLTATGGASGNPVTYSVVSGPGTISGGNLTITGVGTVVVAADQAGNTDYSAAPEVTQSVTCSQLPQVITFNPTSPVTLGVPPITLTATGGASGNPVTFSVVSGPGTLNGNVLTVNGGGSIVIAANQAGNTLYTPAATVLGTINVISDCDSAPAEPVGTTSVTQSAVVKIDHDFTLGSITVGVLGEPGKDFAFVSGGSCTIGTAYTSGQICTVNYTFTPTVPGTRIGSVVLFDNASPTAHIQASVGVTGEGSGPQVAFSHGKQKNVASNLNFPEGVAVDGHGNVYHSVVGGSQILKESFDGTNYTQSVLINSGLNGPYGIAVDCRGNIYVADEDNNQVVKEKWDGEHYIPTPVDTGLNHPNGVAVDCTGNVYVADSGNSRVVRERPNSSGGYDRDTIADSGNNNLKGPQGVAVDGDGCVYILDTFSNRVLKETPSNGGWSESSIPTSTLSNPLGISVDKNRNVYISDSGNNRVIRETRSNGGYSESQIDTSGISAPHGVATDDSGNVYVCDSPNDRIVKIDLSDAPEVDFSASAVGVGSSDGKQTVKITNNGNSDLVFPIPGSGNNPSLSSSDFSFDHSAPSSCPFLSSSDTTQGRLAPGASCDLPISCTPSTLGSLSGSLDLTENNLNGSVTHHITLTGSGVVAGSTNTTLTSSLNPSNAGQSVTIIATVAADNGSTVPTGSVQFSVDGTPVGSAVTLHTGVASLTTSTLAQGSRSVSATYTPTSGSSFVASTSAVLSQTVNFNSSVTIQLGGSQVTYPNSISVTTCVTPATSAAATGYIQLYDGSTFLTTQNLSGNGCAYWNTPSALTAGQHPISAFYSGDSNNAPGSSAPTVLYINPAAVNVALYPSTWNPTYGSTLTLSASVTAPSASSPSAAGTVSFFDGTTLLTTVTVDNNGQASYSTTSLTAGVHSLIATYSGSTNYGSGTVTISVTVGAASQTISFTGLPSNATFGSAGPYTLSATASSGLPVAFSVSGPGSITGNTLTITGAGTVYVAANQAGNSNYAAAPQVSQSIYINKGSQTISFTAPTTPVTYGVSPITLSATATSSLAINFSVLSGPASVSGSTLTITGAGTVVVAADQYGNANYTPASEVTRTIVVNHAAATIALIPSSNPILEQTALTLTATVTGSTTPTGSVNFYDGTASIGTVSLNGSGVAALTTTALSAATHIITAVYSGDGSYSAVTSSAVSEVVDGFALQVPVTGGTNSTPTVTSQPGGTAIFTFTMSPVGTSTFQSAVTLTATGLPSGATYSFSPATIPAGVGTTSVTLTVNLPQTAELKAPMFGQPATGAVTASNTTRPSAGRKLAPFALAALLLLPFMGKARRTRKHLGRLLSVLLLLVALGTAAAITGCGTSSHMPTYNVTVTATSGVIVHSTGFTLQIQ
jgi:sugar lactone lactonase YvrE